MLQKFINFNIEILNLSINFINFTLNFVIKFLNEISNSYEFLPTLNCINETSIGTNTKFPKGLTIPEVLKVPEGNVFKFVLYGVGVIDYKFNANDSTWTVARGDLFYFNNLKEVSSNPNSIVATLLSGVVDQHSGKGEGVIKSAIPGDESLISNKSVAIDLHPTSKIVRGTLGQVVAREGETFSDITYIQGVFSGFEQEPPMDSYPDGYVYRVPIASTHLYYKSA